MIKINKGIEPVELTKYKQQPNASYRDMHGAPQEKVIPMELPSMFIL